MNKSTILCCLLFWLLKPLSANSESPTKTREDAQIVHLAKSLFQEDRLSLICRNPNTGLYSKGIEIPSRYFSKDLMRFFNVACGVNTKPTDLIDASFLDGLSPAACNGNAVPEQKWKPCIESFKLGEPRIHGDQAEIKITYLPDEWAQPYTKLYLLRQDGQWKVDDIDVWGDRAGFGVDDTIETPGISYKSLKATLSQRMHSQK